MRKHGLLTLPVILVVALAFALGSVGTASAGGLTKGMVKKIAGKVVDKKASTLTVSRAATAGAADTAKTATTATSATTATTATNATNAANASALGGQAPSAFQSSTAHALIGADCSVLTQKGGVTALKPTGTTGRCIVSFTSSGATSAFEVSPSRVGGGNTTNQISASLCGGPPVGLQCADGPNTQKDVLVNIQDSGGANVDSSFYITKVD